MKPTNFHRICALWFENPSLPATNDLMSSGHIRIPSYKYIPLSYQLAARLNATPGEFQNTLREVVGLARNILTVAFFVPKKSLCFNFDRMQRSP